MLQTRSLGRGLPPISLAIAAAMQLSACGQPAAMQPAIGGGAPSVPAASQVPQAVSAAGGGGAVAVGGGVSGASALSTAPTVPTLPTSPIAGAPAPSAGAASPPVAGASAAGAAAAPPSAAPPITTSISIAGVQPGVEATKCLQVKLPNTTSVDVTRVHNTLSAGSHHFIVTALTADDAAPAPLADCAGFRGAIKGAPLTITQKHEDEIVLPEGIGYRLKAGQVLHLEMHYVNTSDKPLDIVGTANLYPAPAGAVLQEAAVLLVGTAKINIPARSAHATAPTFLALPAGMEDVKFYAITGHTHRFGTRVKVSSASGPNAAGELLYDPAHFDWEAPEMKNLQPMAAIPRGGGFMLQCEWNNTSDEVLTWGESAMKEMCFFWGYYFPRKPVVSIVIDNIDPAIIKEL